MFLKKAGDPVCFVRRQVVQHDVDLLLVLALAGNWAEVSRLRQFVRPRKLFVRSRSKERIVHIVKTTRNCALPLSMRS